MCCTWILLFKAQDGMAVIGVGRLFISMCITKNRSYYEEREPLVAPFRVYHTLKSEGLPQAGEENVPVVTFSAAIISRLCQAPNIRSVGLAKGLRGDGPAQQVDKPVHARRSR